MVESFDAQRSAARRTCSTRSRRRRRTRVEHAHPRAALPQRPRRVPARGADHRRVALPAWVLAYRYRGAPYRAIVHGQRPEIVFGRSPKDWAKIAAVILAIGAALGAIALAIYLLR